MDSMPGRSGENEEEKGEQQSTSPGGTIPPKVCRPPFPYQLKNRLFSKSKGGSQVSNTPSSESHSIIGASSDFISPTEGNTHSSVSGSIVGERANIISPSKPPRKWGRISQIYKDSRGSVHHKLLPDNWIPFREIGTPKLNSNPPQDQTSAKLGRIQDYSAQSNFTSEKAGIRLDSGVWKDASAAKASSKRSALRFKSRAESSLTPGHSRFCNESTGTTRSSIEFNARMSNAFNSRSSITRMRSQSDLVRGSSYRSFSDYSSDSSHDQRSNEIAALVTQARGGLDVAVSTRSAIRTHREYLLMVFQHDAKYILMMFKKYNEDITLCYDALVEAKDHGVPGYKIKRAELQPDVPEALGKWWSENRPTRRTLSDVENDLLFRRIERMLQNYSAVCQEENICWDNIWKNGHFGFKTFQHEVGSLRGDLINGRIFVPGCTTRDTKLMAAKLNGLLVASVVAWASRWDELDLHRVWGKEAALLIYQHVVRSSESWKMLRIVAGGLGGKGHFSSGALNGMLWTFFQEGYVSEAWIPSEEEMVLVDETRKIMRTKKIRIKFYSRGSSVLLTY